MKYVLTAFCLLLAVPFVRAQSPDEQYVRIYQIIQDADRLKDGGQSALALTRYSEAQEALRRFQNVYPGWNDRGISYRLNYIAGKMSALGSVVKPTNAPPVIATNEPSAAA